MKMGMTGGDKMKKVLAEIGKKSADRFVNVGFIDGATYPDGTSVAQVAFWNEFGHGGDFPSPARPFFRNMISEESGKWAAQLAKALIACGYDSQQALSMMGEFINDELKESIIQYNGVPISPVTALLRDRFRTNPQDIRRSDVVQAIRDVKSGITGAGGMADKPLEWTKTMLNSTSYEVKDGGGE